MVGVVVMVIVLIVFVYGDVLVDVKKLVLDVVV